MKKSKAEGRLALLEGSINAQASSALAPVEFAAIEEGGNGAADYIQLRNRRVEKPSPVVACGKMQKGCERYSNSEPTKMETEDDEMIIKANDVLDVEEDSFGEEIIGGGEGGRMTRESTPLNLIRNPDAIRTVSGSSSNPPTTKNSDSMHQYMPTLDEVSEIFSPEEEKQRKKFIETYNFDPAKEEPLPGRYQWEKLKP